MVPVRGGVCARRLLRLLGAGQGPLLPGLSLSLSRARCSPAGSTAPAIKKRGYDITRNPHLNKVEGALKKKAQNPLLTGPL
ncbi:hypothetical protein TURU_113244 [Turdus rufiventris]|nr:hypothetical protein TURU_113244 [Turdus rufiventris]